MNKIEGIFLWAGMFSYLMGFAVLLSSWVFKNGWQRRGLNITAAGFILHIMSMGVRWYEAGHPPVQGNYENALLGAWFLILIYLASAVKIPGIIPFGVLINPVALLIIGLGLRTPAKTEALTAPYQSNWLWIHVGFAWLAFGAFAIAFVIGLVYIAKHYRHGILAEPYLSKLDELMLAYVIFGFIAQAFMLGSGAIWAATLWGAYWSWDPVETWALICWLVYGLILHLRLTWNWRGKKMAWISVLGIIAMVVTFWGIGVGQGIHTPLL
ncbi:MAG: cytochrome c biogenesis protein CcsA [Eubacteriales bacterium]